MSFVRLEASKFDDTRGGAEEAIGAHCVIHMLLSNRHTLVCLGFGNHASLNLDLILTVRGIEISNTFRVAPTKFKPVVCISGGDSITLLLGIGVTLIYAALYGYMVHRAWASEKAFTVPTFFWGNHHFGCRCHFFRKTTVTFFYLLKLPFI